MRAIVQRVSSASVTVDGKIAGEIGNGLLILLGIHVTDNEESAKWLANKTAGLRIFPDDDDRMNLAVSDIGGQILVVSNFTVYGDSAKGFRPNFMAAARPEQAIPLYELYMDLIREKGVNVQSGVFGAMMEVELVNDGPVTLVVESP